MKYLSSKIAITIYILAFIGLGVWGYSIYKNRYAQAPTNETQQNKSADNDASSTITSTDDLILDDEDDVTADNSDVTSPATADADVPTVSSESSVSGSTLAHITPEHCDSNCQAFANDLKFFEYCQQTCGISPVKDVSDCDAKKDIQKDYCLKDMAISDEDPTVCDQISDANIKQSCKNRIEQDTIEELQLSNPRSNPEF